jgi:hypothetical protein
MITLDVNKTDDPQFIGVVSSIVNASINQYHPADVYLVEIDHCFDRKWQRFAGNTLGVVSSWNRRLVIPPFDPRRVVSQSYYRLDATASGSYELADARPLHRKQYSAHNLSRWLSQVSESGVFVWYSGETVSSNQASILFYHIDSNSTSDWFASFNRNKEWRLNRARDISRRMLEAMIGRETGEGRQESNNRVT